MSSWAVSKKRFQRDLLAWFALEGRDFPWRHRTDAYSILIAEKLLQQTVARRALVEAYDQILKQYPDPSALSSAKVRDLKKIIRPLGFSYRAKELIMLAHTLVSKYGGKVPTSLRDLMTLPGVGDYSARAVLSFAYGEDVPVVDTNVARFLYRLYGLQGPMPKNPARKKSLIQLASRLVPAKRSKEFNLAVLDLCAQICILRNPRCGSCPALRYCAYGRDNQQMVG